ncbi:MAG: class IV adenylate cyclase, partial [Planctomycetota bacterium]
YDRANTTAAKQSDYEIAAVADPQLLKQVLQRALGVTQIIEKKRVYYLVDQTRMHLDSVVGLGNFLELEVVLRPNQSPAEGHAIAADLLRRLEIRDTDLMATAYADMLE